MTPNTTRPSPATALPDKLLPKADPKDFAREVILHESHAVMRTADLIDHHFAKALALLENCKGNVIVSGIGKSGIIGMKISATLASVGVPSYFIHATEAMHGDLGRIGDRDVALLLSYSGATEEVVSLAAVLKQNAVPIISISKSQSSHLGTLSTAPLSVGDIREPCPHNLAPTSSTTAMLAIGDAIALTVSRQKQFSASDFQRRHPGGQLGKRMLPITTVLRFIVGENVAVTLGKRSIREALSQGDTTKRRSGAILVVDTNGRLKGIFTDADLRRLLTTNGDRILNSPLEDVMTWNPACLRETDRIMDALELIQQRRVDEIPVVDKDGTPVGILDIQDLILLKLIEQ